MMQEEYLKQINEISTKHNIDIDESFGALAGNIAKKVGSQGLKAGVKYGAQVAGRFAKSSAGKKAMAKTAGNLTRKYIDGKKQQPITPQEQETINNLINQMKTMSPEAQQTLLQQAGMQ